MNQIVEKLNERILELNEIIRKKEKDVKKAPKGIINIAQTGDRIQYYYKNSSSDKVRKYMRDKDKPKIKALCQREYDEKVLLVAKKELAQLEKLKNYYKKGTYEDLYNMLHPKRKELVCSVELLDEEFIAQWEKMEYQKKGFREDMPEYYTDKGERVRSKSEILIANTLKKYHVPYRYEAPLHINGFGIIHPDFTVLNIRERKEYYWEHMGRMDDSSYLEDALNRIYMYEKNGIFPGDKLILSHETIKYPLNLRNIEKLIEQYLK